MPAAPRRPLIAHVVHRFDVGGMENGIVNLLNRLPVAFADHCVIALTQGDERFADRIQRSDVRIVELHKPPGQTARILPRLFRHLQVLRPTIFHTRNVGTLETQIAACLARVPVRIHGEHGWDVGDLAGESRKMLWLRRLMRPMVHHQIALSVATHRYLVDRVRVSPDRVTKICNGVDAERFSPPNERFGNRRTLWGDHFPSEAFVVGAIGRIAAVKNLTMLIDAFAMVRQHNHRFAARARLAVVGDGPDAHRVRRFLEDRNLLPFTWMPGARSDIPVCLGALDLLCLPSLAEGISNTILEAMSCGLPVIATDVGGNAELVLNGVSGQIIESGSVASLAAHIEKYFTDATMREAHGRAGRIRAVTEFSLDAMVGSYHRLYLAQLQRAGLRSATDAAACAPRPRA